MAASGRAETGEDGGGAAENRGACSNETVARCGGCDIRDTLRRGSGCRSTSKPVTISLNGARGSLVMPRLAKRLGVRFLDRAIPVCDIFLILGLVDQDFWTPAVEIGCLLAGMAWTCGLLLTEAAVLWAARRACRSGVGGASISRPRRLG